MIMITITIRIRIDLMRCAVLWMGTPAAHVALAEGAGGC